MAVCVACIQLLDGSGRELRYIEDSTQDDSVRLGQRLRACMHARACEIEHVFVYIYICVCVRACVRVYVHLYWRMQEHICMRVHIGRAGVN